MGDCKMKEYFNKTERDTHIILLFMAEIISNFKDSNALTNEEQECLYNAEDNLRAFTKSIYQRFGDAYKRKIKGTLEVNTVRVGSKYGQDMVYSYYDASDLEKQVQEMIAFHCIDCEKCDYKSCPTYDMAITCGIEGKNDGGCPYKW